ncbi:MAG: JmjC domain-containing protein [Bacillota bacterium]
MDAFSPSSTASRDVDAGRSGLLSLDEGTCRDGLGRREFGITHSLAGHPLLSLEALAELADALPPGAVERHDANQPLLVPGGAEELSGPPSETVRTIEHNGRWMVMWNLEQIAPYKQLMDQVLDEALPHLPPREGEMGRRESFLFLSAPHSITPVHFDPEHNFLLQIRGTKEVDVGRFPDKAWELRELNRYYDGGHRNLVEIPPRSGVFYMRPGDGIYLYPWAPHWVYNGPEVSVSLSITFRTARSQREENASLFNRRLRRRGWSPRPAGESEMLDRAKASAVAFMGWVRRGGERQRGTRDYS